MSLEKVKADIMQLVESGLTPEEIVKHLEMDAEKKQMSLVDENIPSEIKIISQAMSYRSPTLSEYKDITKLINITHIDEIIGEESFRTGDCVSEEFVYNLLNDSEYQWILVEAPNGFGVEKDGLILGLGCYTTTGISKKNGEIEGNVGSIRFLCVLPRFRGLCIGLRLLQRIERNMLAQNCCRIMISVPSTRQSMISWLNRRGLTAGNSVKYPVQSTGHHLTKDDVALVIYHKRLEMSSVATDVFNVEEESDSSNELKTNEPHVSVPAPAPSGYPNSHTQNLNLPPHWRQVPPQVPSPEEEQDAEVFVEVLGVD